MDWDDYLDPDIIYNPMYWLLVAGAEFAILLGFKAQTLWSTEVSMPLISKIAVLLCIPIMGYFVTKKVAG
jgi:uncharacterized membrane protein